MAGCQPVAGVWLDVVRRFQEPHLREAAAERPACFGRDGVGAAQLHALRESRAGQRRDVLLLPDLRPRDGRVGRTDDRSGAWRRVQGNQGLGEGPDRPARIVAESRWLVQEFGRPLDGEQSGPYYRVCAFGAGARGQVTEGVLMKRNATAKWTGSLKDG